MAIISLDTAKAHLRIASASGDTEDDDIQRKLEMAEFIVLDYLETEDGSPPAWTDETDTPKVVQAAMLYTLAELYRFRGDDQEGQGPKREMAGSLSPFAEGLLRRYRESVVA